MSRTNWCACGRGRRSCWLRTTRMRSEQVQKYRDYLLGVVSDVEFPRGGRADAEARFRTWRAWCAKRFPMCRSCCNPAAPNSADRAHAEGFSFLRKRSPTLLGDLRRILDRTVGLRRFRFSHARRHAKSAAPRT